MRVCTIGSMNTGKTSLVRRITDLNIKNVTSTIGLDYQVLRKGYKKIEFWDTAGQERYRSLVPMYLKRCDIALLVIDVMDYNLSDIEYWRDYIWNNSSHCLIYLILNKWDLKTLSFKEIEKIENLFLQDNVKIFKTSAFKNKGIDILVNDLLSLAIENKDYFAEVTLDSKKPFWKCW